MEENINKLAEDYVLKIHDNIETDGLIPIKDMLLTLYIAYKDGYNECRKNYEKTENENSNLKEEVEELKDKLDALHMTYLSQVSLWKSRYEELENPVNEKE